MSISSCCPRAKLVYGTHTPVYTFDVFLLQLVPRLTRSYRVQDKNERPHVGLMSTERDGGRAHEPERGEIWMCAGLAWTDKANVVDAAKWRGKTPQVLVEENHLLTLSTP